MFIRMTANLPLLVFNPTTPRSSIPMETTSVAEISFDLLSPHCGLLDNSATPCNPLAEDDEGEAAVDNNTGNAGLELTTKEGLEVDTPIISLGGSKLFSVARFLAPGHEMKKQRYRATRTAPAPGPETYLLCCSLGISLGGDLESCSYKLEADLELVIHHPVQYLHWR
ncbi:hypothetical protein K435DRAFT_838306 [Dendrothele bispora CBS 962.96]|uniref:Uncharacterized protein n=1 Tax=Dendrothele bispora (strain CBS 962.96) TaxID=1314807 RepID=A0A4S8M6U2_DENBC|nr:hypothetical protein K435DRAFT_838306 [Dendrothele bispora CBS 962.96]